MIMYIIFCLYLLIVHEGAAGAAQSGSNGCTLPPYPPHGTYIAQGKPEAIPGQTYDLAILTVTCDPGYVVNGNNSTFCYSNNNWQPMPRCTRCGTSITQGQQLKRHAIATFNDTTVTHGEFPWHAAIYDKTYSPYKQICGGSLISTRAIISAAHCFWSDSDGQQPASRYAVAMGKIYRAWDDHRDSGAHKSDVKEIKIPARYLGVVGNFQDDIAVVLMSTPVVYSQFIGPVCLDFDVEFDRRQLRSGSFGKIPGWRRVAADVKDSVLINAELPYVDARNCLSSLPSELKPYFTSDKICASTDGGIACPDFRGNSGGGLVFPEVDSGTRRHFLRGVLSVGPRDKCNENTFILFTHVQSHATRAGFAT